MLKKLMPLVLLTLSIFGYAHAMEDEEKPSQPKVIFITGASGDIGFAATEHFLKKGHKVIGQSNEVSESNGWKRLHKLRDQFPEALKITPKDFSSNSQEIREFFTQTVLEKCGSIDILINSVGVEVEDTSDEVILRTMAINFHSPRFLCDAAVEHFIEAIKPGIIINLGSRAAFRGMPKGYYTYAASKAALTTYSQDIARDNAPHGISVFVVAPGPVEGRMFQGLREDIKAQCLSSMPTGKPVKLQEVVDMIDFLASGKVPSATGSVFDLMGASYRH